LRRLKWADLPAMATALNVVADGAVGRHLLPVFTSFVAGRKKINFF
jgi:hypothetical protein